ncbi:unnamed protein product, partial [marine sediment metagenome]
RLAILVEEDHLANLGVDDLPLAPLAGVGPGLSAVGVQSACIDGTDLRA